MAHGNRYIAGFWLEAIQRRLRFMFQVYSLALEANTFNLN